MSSNKPWTPEMVLAYAFNWAKKDGKWKPEDVEDMAQYATIYVLSSMAPEMMVKATYVKAAVRNCISMWRRNKWRRSHREVTAPTELLDTREANGCAFTDVDNAAMIAHAKTLVTPEDWEVIERLADGEGIVEIARSRGTNHTSLNRRLDHARSRLRFLVAA